MPDSARKLPRHALAVVCLVASMAAAPAFAAAGEHQLWLGAGAGADGPAVDGRYLFDISDFWSIGGGLEHRLGWPIDAGSTVALAEARMVIDALTFVPALSLTGGAVADWPGAELAALARLEASVAWRPTRTWGLLLRLGVEQRLDPTAIRSVLVSVAWGRFLGGASDLDL